MTIAPTDALRELTARLDDPDAVRDVAQYRPATVGDIALLAGTLDRLPAKSRDLVLARIAASSGPLIEAAEHTVRALDSARFLLGALADTLSGIVEPLGVAAGRLTSARCATLAVARGEVPADRGVAHGATEMIVAGEAAVAEATEALTGCIEDARRVAAMLAENAAVRAEGWVPGNPATSLH